jgi:hypothetical protein
MTQEGYRATKAEITKMTRNELVRYLEGRGTACFREDTTKELRACALEEARDA